MGNLLKQDIKTIRILQNDENVCITDNTEIKKDTIKQIKRSTLHRQQNADNVNTVTHRAPHVKIRDKQNNPDDQATHTGKNVHRP